MVKKSLRVFLFVNLVLLVFLFGLNMEVTYANSTLFVQRISDGESLDPALTTAMDDYMVLMNIYSGLFRYKPGTFEIEADLAVDWEISDDGREWIFYLREGVQFHKDFGELTSEDVKFTIERILDPATKSVNVGQFQNIKEVNALDRYTVQILLKEPDLNLKHRLVVTRPFGGLVVSKKAVQEYGDNYASNPIGTGPFQFVERVRRERLLLEANPDYYEGPPVLKEVSFLTIPDEATSSLALERGDIHIAEVYDPRVIERAIKADDYGVIGAPRPSIHKLMINTRVEPLDNPLVRQAIAHAVNTEEIIEGILGGNALKPVSAIHPLLNGFTDEVHEYPYNPEKARELLAEAGYPNGFNTRVVNYSFGQWVPILELIQAQLTRVGINIQIDVHERGTYVEARAREDTPIVMFGITTTPIAEAVLDLYHSRNIPPGGLNFMRYDGADEALNAASKEASPEKRLDFLKEAQIQISADIPSIPLYHPEGTYLVRNQVEGYTPDPFGGIWLYTISLP